MDKEAIKPRKYKAGIPRPLKDGYLGEEEDELKIINKPTNDLKPSHTIQKEIPPLSEGQYDSLKKDVQERGIQVPIEITEKGIIICGHHRWRAAQELGLENLPCVVRELDSSALLLHAIKDNLYRRQLRKEQREALILKLSESSRKQGRPRKDERMTGLMTQKEIADTVGVSGRTLRRVRQKSKKVAKWPVFQKRAVNKVRGTFKYNEELNDEIDKFLSDLASHYDAADIDSVEVVATVKEKRIEVRK